MRFYGSDANANLGYARALTKDISEAWVRGDKSFDVGEWFNERKKMRRIKYDRNKCIFAAKMWNSHCEQ